MSDSKQTVRGKLGPDTPPPLPRDPRAGGDIGERTTVAENRGRETAQGTLPPLAPPNHERYQDLAEIDSGGMGEVRRVFDRELRRTLAMKILAPELVASQRARARFWAEASMTAQLQHPGIVAVHDRGVLEDGRLWFTMSEVRGRTLTRVIDELHAPSAVPDPLLLRRVVEMFQRICEAVAYAHGRGVVHRDLKPSNLMVGEFGQVLVMDWGLARRWQGYGDKSERESTPPSNDEAPSDSQLTDHLTHDGEVLGTPAYMPPEQARGDRTAIGPASDVYSLGAVLYNILSGQAPYSESSSAALAAVLAGPPAPLDVPHSVPRPLLTLCEYAMAREARERPSSARELIDDVRGWLDGARRRDDARHIVSRADAMEPAIHRARERAASLRSRARDGLAALRPFDPVEHKAPVWALEDEADDIDREAALADMAWLDTVRSALNRDPDLPEAHGRLASYYSERLAAAEAAGRHAEAARYEAQVARHNRGECDRILAGKGLVSLVTNPAGATATAFRYVQRQRGLELTHHCALGATPIVGASLPRGSYLIVVEAPGRCPVRYPVSIERDAHWDGVAPGDSSPRLIELPRLDDIADDEVYVPAGWFWSGGDDLAVESLPRRRLWIDALIARRHPVTNAEYLVFLNALVARGEVDAARAAAPRVPRGSAGGAQEPLAYDLDGEGRYRLADYSSALPWREDTPVALIDWRGASAYVAWLAEESDMPWRLPNELEWEKLARGADGRNTSWGNHVEPTRARMLGSIAGVPTPVAVTDYPSDESPYGVRGVTGNVREWCGNVWRLDGPTLDGARVLPDIAAGADPELRAVRGGAWSSMPDYCRIAGRFAMAPGDRFGAVGLRAVRSPWVAAR